jgi:hypothetical protein
VNQKWDMNVIQFPRLLGEIWAIGLSEDQYKALSESMGTTTQEIQNVFERADDVFEQQKELTFRPKSARWVKNGNDIIDAKTFRPILIVTGSAPDDLREYVLDSILHFLNTDAKTR